MVADVIQRWRTSSSSASSFQEQALELAQYPVIHRDEAHWQLVSLQFHDPQSAALSGELPTADIDGALDLKAVPRPADTVQTEWSRTPTSTSIVYRYDAHSYTAAEAVDFFTKVLPANGWAANTFGTSPVAQSYAYDGPQPLSTLSVVARPDATVQVNLTHATRSSDDFAIFAGRPLQLPPDLPGSHDLKAVPRPPDSVITDETFSRGQVQITYKYDWEKHSKNEVLELYLSELPDRGWTLNSWQPIEQVRKSRQATFNYSGTQPLRTLSLRGGVRNDHVWGASRRSMMLSMARRMNASLLAGSTS